MNAPRLVIPALLLGGLVLLTAGCQSAAKPLNLSDERQRISYTIGIDISQGMKQQELDLDQDALFAGLRDGLAGTEAKLSEEEQEAAKKAFVESLKEKAMARQKKEADESLQKGELFLAENAKKEGVVTLPSGLQYKVITEGKGAKPVEGNQVKVHYRGTLVDGTEFDSSLKRGEPAVFPIGGVIAGWNEALPMMKVGSKWELYIPAKLAYGERGAGNVIPPNSALIFEVELLGFEKAK